jgi:phosphate transport system protein
MAHFVEELQQLRAALVAMSSLVEAAICRGIAAVVQRNASLGREVLKEEARINRMEIDIDEIAISLLALRQPMAADLRFIVAAIKINNNLERMGDLAVNLAQRAISLDEPGAAPAPMDIERMTGVVTAMMRNSFESFIERDADLARSVLASDDAVDELRSFSEYELIRYMEDGMHSISECVDWLAIVRNLERIADHATNIAEGVIFLVKGIDVRHHAAPAAALDSTQS